MSRQDLFDSSLALFERYDAETHIRTMSMLQTRSHGTSVCTAYRQGEALSIPALCREEKTARNGVYR